MYASIFRGYTSVLHSHVFNDRVGDVHKRTNLPEEEKRDYNVTFKADKRYWLGIAVIKNNKKLSPSERKEHILLFTKKLRIQAKKHNVDQIVFYGPSPVMMKCYLDLLHYAFDKYSKIHGWCEIIEHVSKRSKTIKVIHKLTHLV